MNITFTPSVDSALLREMLLGEIERELSAQGYARDSGEVDFLVLYELEIVGADDGGSLAERGRGRILIRDTATGRFVWRGERKAVLVIPAEVAEGERRMRSFARELLQYVYVLR